MPHEKINYPRGGAGHQADIVDGALNPDGSQFAGKAVAGDSQQKQMVIGWNRIGWVQVSLYPQKWNDTGDGEHVDLNPQELDLLIETLKRARRQAYRSGRRHVGFEDAPPAETRPLFTSP